MKTFSLIDLENLTPAIWQRIAILNPQTTPNHKVHTLESLYNQLGFDDDFFTLLTYISNNKKQSLPCITAELDVIALKALQKVQFKTNQEINNLILKDIKRYLESGRSCTFRVFEPVKPYELGQTNHNGGTTSDVVQAITEDGIICDQGFGCYIHNGENYIIFSLIKAILDKDWKPFFQSYAFHKNPEKSLEHERGSISDFESPSYRPQGNFTKPLLTQSSLQKQLKKAILNSK
ncbi:MAG: hypothetical protein CMF61_03695 [Magnetococcales bacterium]|nr:hypothetical protein [Magnetococcales bacterium]